MLLFTTGSGDEGYIRKARYMRILTWCVKLFHLMMYDIILLFAYDLLLSNF